MSGGAGHMQAQLGCQPAQASVGDLDKAQLAQPNVVEPDSVLGHLL
jgi:hypothetical protein